MPIPSVEPMPPDRESRLVEPDDAQDASYLAASARIAKRDWRSACAMRTLYVTLFVHEMFYHKI